MPPTDQANAADTLRQPDIDLFRSLRRVGIRTATDLLAAGGWLTQAATIRLADVECRQRALQAAVAQASASANGAWLPSALYEVSQAVVSSPNWVFVANFRRSSRRFLGDEVKTWMVMRNPPCPDIENAAGSAAGVAQAPTTNGVNHTGETATPDPSPERAPAPTSEPAQTPTRT
jgi:hypothetical protein